MNCTSRYGKPCRCQRLSRECDRCGQPVTVSAGERAAPIPHDKGKLIGYICNRCR